MKLSPLDIRKQEFTRGFRGYDADEVDAFLQMVSSQWEELLDARRRLEQRVEDLEGKVRHYERVEEALQEALATARQNARQIVDGAHHKAQSLLNEAEAKAHDIKRGAEEERVRLKREINRLGNRQDEVVARLRAFLMSELELLARFEGDDPIGFIKLLPAREGPAAGDAGTRPRRLRADTAEDEDEAPGRPSALRSLARTTAPEAQEPAKPEAPRPAPRPAPVDEDPAPPARTAVAAVPRPERAPDPEPAADEYDDDDVDESVDRIVEPLISASDEADGDVFDARDAAENRPAGASDEIERIRRILRDLD